RRRDRRLVDQTGGLRGGRRRAQAIEYAHPRPPPLLQAGRQALAAPQVEALRQRLQPRAARRDRLRQRRRQDQLLLGPRTGHIKSTQILLPFFHLVVRLPQPP